MEKQNQSIKFSVALIRVFAANVGLIACAYLGSAFFFEDHAGVRGFVLVCSLTLWVCLPVAVTSVCRSHSENRSPKSEQKIRIVLLCAISLGIISCSYLLFGSWEPGLGTFIPWQLGAAAFSVAAACLAVGKGPPLSFDLTE